MKIVFLTRSRQVPEKLEMKPWDQLDFECFKYMQSNLIVFFFTSNTDIYLYQSSDVDSNLLIGKFAGILVGPQCQAGNTKLCALEQNLPSCNSLLQRVFHTEY